jgi:hypothetical protein
MQHHMTRTILALLAVLTLSACQTPVADAGEIIYVDSKVVDCEGLVPQKCLLTRNDENAQWTYFYSQIAGFQHEPGYSYKLLVKITKIDNPPQDSSSLQYELIDILEKN